MGDERTEALDPFGDWLGSMFRYFNKHLQKDQAKIYRTNLKHIDLEILDQAWQEFVKHDTDAKRPPLISYFVEYSNRVARARRAAESQAKEEVREEIDPRSLKHFLLRLDSLIACHLPLHRPIEREEDTPEVVYDVLEEVLNQFRQTQPDFLGLHREMQQKVAGEYIAWGRKLLQEKWSDESVPA